MQSRGRRCYVHIGPAKTGTSYLQNVFWSSRDQLASLGLALLLEPRDHYHVALRLNRPAEKLPPDALTVLDRLRTAAASLSPDCDALITQERLSQLPRLASVRHLLDQLSGFEVHVIITARDLARQIPSVWQQNIKKRQTHAYQDFLAAIVERGPLAEPFWLRQDLLAISARWGRAVPPERVHIVTVPPSGSPPGLLLDRFCSVMGVDPTQLITDTVFSNRSLGFAQAEVLRRVNIALGEALADPPSPSAWSGQFYLAKEVLPAQAGDPPGFPGQLQDWCTQTSAAIVAELGSRGYDVVGDLADLLPTFSAASRSTAQPGDAEVIAAATAALATAVTGRYVEEEERQRLRARTRTRTRSARSRGKSRRWARGRTSTSRPNSGS